MKRLFAFFVLFGLALADFDNFDLLVNPAPLPCNKNNCEGRELLDCMGLNAFAAYADDGCGGGGGHAVYSDFSAARPQGFGESRWLFEVVNGSTTGRLEFYGNTVGSAARLYGSLVGASRPQDKWDLILELEKETTGTHGTKNELNQNCPVANANSLQASWTYWKLRPGTKSYLIGKGPLNEGCTIEIIFDRSNMYVGQVGYGGSEKNARFGITGWISYKEFIYDDVLWPPNDPSRPRFDFRSLSSRMKDGDINVNAYCACQCPAPPPPTPECGNNIVEGPEECDGGDCCNTDCTYKSSTTICRPARGECDAVERCTGEDATCPEDAFRSSLTVCDETVGFCDVRIQNTCPGDGPDCHGPPSISIDQGLTPWESFNVISFHNYFATNGDVEGRLAVRDNLVITGGFTIGLITDTTPQGSDNFVPAALVVGHNTTWSGTGNIYPDGTGSPNQSYQEGAFLGEIIIDFPDYLLPQVIGISTVVGDKDADFDAARVFYTNLQNRFASFGDNVQVTPQYGGLFLKCISMEDTIYFASIDGADLSTSTWWSLDNCNFQSSFVLNIRGSGAVTIGGGRFPAIIERVIFNVLGSGRSINLLTEIAGNLLAPNNVYNQSNGVSKGLVIVGDVVQVVQSNLPNCEKFDDVVISARTRARIEGGELVPVFNFGSFNVDDEVTVGDESGTITDGVYDEEGNLFLLVDPPLEKTHDEGTTITSIISNPGNTPRTAIKAVKYVPSESAASSLVASLGLIAALLLALF